MRRSHPHARRTAATRYLAGNRIIRRPPTRHGRPRPDAAGCPQPGRNGIEAMTASTHPPVGLGGELSDGRTGQCVDRGGGYGTGLDTTKVDHIFDAFFTTKPEGMGMRLSICRSIVEAHGGRLWASPNSPGGVSFSSLCRRRPTGLAKREAKRQCEITRQRRSWPSSTTILIYVRP